jgi:hypothetical protein
MNLSPAAMTKLKKQGMPVHSLDAALAWRRERQNIAQRKPIPAAAPTPVADAPPLNAGAMPSTNSRSDDRSQFEEARTRRELAEAQLAELKLRELRGDLIRRDVVDRVVAERAQRTREAVMQIKGRLAPLLAAESNAVKVASLLDGELRAALAQGAE